MIPNYANTSIQSLWIHRIDDIYKHTPVTRKNPAILNIFFIKTSILWILMNCKEFFTGFLPIKKVKFRQLLLNLVAHYIFLLIYLFLERFLPHPLLLHSKMLHRKRHLPQHRLFQPFRLLSHLQSFLFRIHA